MTDCERNRKQVVIIVIIHSVLAVCTVLFVVRRLYTVTSIKLPTFI